MGNIGFKSKRQHFLPIEAEEIFRTAQVKTMTDDGFRRIFEFLIVETVHTTKIRDSRLCTYTGTAKENDSTAFRNPLFQKFQFSHNNLLSCMPRILPFQRTFVILMFTLLKAQDALLDILGLSLYLPLSNADLHL